MLRVESVVFNRLTSVNFTPKTIRGKDTRGNTIIFNYSKGSGGYTATSECGTHSIESKDWINLLDACNGKLNDDSVYLN